MQNKKLHPKQDAKKNFSETVNDVTATNGREKENYKMEDKNANAVTMEELKNLSKPKTEGMKVLEFKTVNDWKEYYDHRRASGLSLKDGNGPILTRITEESQPLEDFLDELQTFGNMTTKEELLLDACCDPGEQDYEPEEYEPEEYDDKEYWDDYYDNKEYWDDYYDNKEYWDNYYDRE